MKCIGKVKSITEEERKGKKYWKFTFELLKKITPNGLAPEIKNRKAYGYYYLQNSKGQPNEEVLSLLRGTFGVGTNEELMNVIGQTCCLDIHVYFGEQRAAKIYSDKGLDGLNK